MPRRPTPSCCRGFRSTSRRTIREHSITNPRRGKGSYSVTCWESDFRPQPRGVHRKCWFAISFFVAFVPSVDLVSELTEAARNTATSMVHFAGDSQDKPRHDDEDASCGHNESCCKDHSDMHPLIVKAPRKGDSDFVVPTRVSIFHLVSLHSRIAHWTRSSVG